MKKNIKIGDEWEYINKYDDDYNTVYHNFRVLILDHASSASYYNWNWKVKITYKHPSCYSVYKLHSILDFNISSSPWNLWKCGTVKKIKG